MNNKKQARIINACIEDVQAGLMTREQCLLKHPSLSEDIQSAFSTIDIISGITYSAETEIDPRLQKVKLLQKLPDREEFVTKRVDNRYRLHNLKRRFMMTWVVIVTTILSLISGAGAVYASNEALPGDILYPVKMWTEDFQLAIAPDDMDMDLYVQFANTRIEEAVRLIQEDRVEDLNAAVDGYQLRSQLITQSMQRVQSENPEEAIRLRLDLEEKLQDQARIMQAYVLEEGDSEEIGVFLREQMRLMLETNTRLSLRIKDVEYVSEDDIQVLETDEQTPEEEPAVDIKEDDSAKNEARPASMQVNDEFGMLIFGLGGSGGNGVYAEVNGMQYDCDVENDAASCRLDGAPQKGNVNLYDRQTNQLLFSYSYEFKYAYGHKFQGENSDNENNGDHDMDGGGGMDSDKNGKGN